ncbi:N-acetyltransferase [Pseudoalteromonas tunicata]|jgi:acetyltransferase-like isoleucine patch superfamily enzyme|uniref:WxcM-like protein n=1 Tax=Pseudoalteromonas tunicata D2 TaxID=87626 RepID=A4C8J1_9GAMM|nr:acyltransferase [Pseudoalteromonas tunicata]AXT32452.1 N-acetyltransferase [Pseudoalteromonas tunicata]EAR28906.1 WxcM-like protein [Pseudoalteromonas tunicata D2]
MMIHPLADVHTDKIGQGTRVWQFSVVLDGAIIGENCNICAHTLIEGNVLVGDRVTLKSGVFLWSGLRVEDDVFIGPNATFTNDMLPRSQQYPQQYPLTLIKKGASIGANATILPGVIIGEKAMVGAGAVVTKDVAPYSVVVGNPAKHIRFIDKESSLNV